MPSRRHALLVGIDSYPNLPPANQLRCCANDARLLAGVLQERFGFHAGEVTLLLDADATRDGILGALDALLAAAGEGDAVVFFYSGHGSQLVAANNYEPDALYETLVPHDGAIEQAGRRDIRDAQIYDWLLRLSAITRNVVVIADTCHSGHVARSGETPPREKWIPAARAIEAGPRPATEAGPMRGSNPRPAAAGGDTLRRTRDAGTPASFLPCDERYVLLAACRGTEHAKELVSPPNSAFTYCLCQELRTVPAEATYRYLMERVRPAVAAKVTDQTPQIEGARDRLLFEQTVSLPTPFLAVLERRPPDRVRLGGGAVHGVEPGSVWAVHPAGTLHPSSGQEQGLVRIQSVEAVQAEARIIAERERIEAGARAFEHAKPAGRLRLAVQPPGPGVTGDEEIRRWITSRSGAASLLRLPDEGEPPAVRIEAFPASHAGAFDLDEPSLLALDHDNTLLLPPAPIRDAGALPQLLRSLEDFARSHNLLAIKSDDADPDALAKKIKVTLLRHRAGADFEPAEPGPSGEVIYREGDLLALRITHQAPHTLYFHIFDIGLLWAVNLIYPLPGANDEVHPKHPFDIGTRPGQTLSVSFPPRFADRARAARQSRLAGRETLRIFATTQEADLTGLQSPTTRGTPSFTQGGSLASRLDQALGRRAMRGDSPAPEERWAALDLSFVVSEKGAW